MSDKFFVLCADRQCHSRLLPSGFWAKILSIERVHFRNFESKKRINLLKANFLPGEQLPLEFSRSANTSYLPLQETMWFASLKKAFQKSFLKFSQTLSWNMPNQTKIAWNATNSGNPKSLKPENGKTLGVNSTLLTYRQRLSQCLADRWLLKRFALSGVKAMDRYLIIFCLKRWTQKRFLKSPDTLKPKRYGRTDLKLCHGLWLKAILKFFEFGASKFPT